MTLESEERPQRTAEEIYCWNCGRPIHRQAVICVKCGVSARGPSLRIAGTKSKTTAILLAVFFSYWSWLYTFQKNKAKFFIGLGCQGLCLIICFMVYLGRTDAFYYHRLLNTPVFGFGIEHDTASLFMTFAISIGVWIWSIVDNSTKPEPYFSQYPN